MPTSPAGNVIVGLGGETLPASSAGNYHGGRRGGLKTKTLRRMLKKAGLKTTGKKATLRARVKKAHLRGGSLAGTLVSGVGGPGSVGGRRRRRRGGGETPLGSAGNYDGGRRRRRHRGGEESDSD